MTETWQVLTQDHMTWQHWSLTKKSFHIWNNLKYCVLSSCVWPVVPIFKNPFHISCSCVWKYLHLLLSRNGQWDPHLQYFISYGCCNQQYLVHFPLIKKELIIVFSRTLKIFSFNLFLDESVSSQISHLKPSNCCAICLSKWSFDWLIKWHVWH